MKKNILTLIIGILIGSIITTAIFLILKEEQSVQENQMPFMDEKFQNRENDFSIPEGKFNKDNEDVDNIEQ